jgi:N6-adenosine-specific RNA methylase IME4
VSYVGDEPAVYVVSANLRRRHLDESQRAMIAAKLATMKQGARTDLSPIGEMSQASAAELLNVGKRSVERAAEVRESGAPELVRAVEMGAVSVAAAADVATMPHDEQREIVARGEGEILRRAQEIRVRKTQERRTKRLAMVAAMADAGPLPQDRKYPVIYADPPWRFEFSPSASRSVENHYPTLSIDEICERPVGEIATPSAVLFLFVPASILEQAFEVIRAWGFKYRTGAIWRKTGRQTDNAHPGQGHYFRQAHEHLLLATRGDMPTPHENARPLSVFDAPRPGENSRKPDLVYELIERMYPTLPKIELFARNKREGWDAWGNQAPAPQPTRSERWREHRRALKEARAKRGR